VNNHRPESDANLFKPQKCIHLVDDYLRERDAPRIGASNDTNKKVEFNKSVVIDTLVDPTSAKDHSVLDASQLAEEVIMLLSAGNDTTSDAMIVGIYRTVRSTSVYKRLTEELITAFPSHVDITYDKVKKLPYLVRVINFIRYLSTFTDVLLSRQLSSKKRLGIATRYREKPRGWYRKEDGRCTDTRSQQRFDQIFIFVVSAE
jgi:hypothetical protein